MALTRASWSDLRVGDVVQFGPGDRGIVTRHSHRAAPFGPGYGVTYRPVPADYAGEGFTYGGTVHTFPYAHPLDGDRTRYEFPYGATAVNRFGRNGARVHMVKRAYRVSMKKTYAPVGGTAARALSAGDCLAIVTGWLQGRTASDPYSLQRAMVSGHNTHGNHGHLTRVI